MLKPLLLLITLLLVTGSSVLSQDRLPVRDYVDPGELVSMNRETSFDLALQILNEFSQEYTGKVIINRSDMRGNIGLQIPSMPWRQALDFITSYNNVVVRELADRFEIVNYSRDEIPERRAISLQQELGVNFETREVEISATFFEGSRRMLREMGIDWTSIHNGMVRVTNIAAANVSQDVFRVDANVSELLNIEQFELNAIFSAFEATNNGEVLASPTIKVMDGEMGRVQVGQDFSIKQRDFAGNVIDQFVSTGTILEVTPRVITRGDSTFIFMNLRAERSTASPDVVSTIVSKQEAQTQILLLSGESTVIAGLYETDETRVRRGIPLLKDLPPWFFGLRYLFGYNSSEYTVNELVIVIEANLVPSLGERLNMPFRTRPQQIDETRRGFHNMEEIETEISP